MRRILKNKMIAIVLMVIMLIPILPQPIERSYAADGGYAKYYRYERYNYLDYKLIFQTQTSGTFTPPFYKSFKREGNVMVGVDQVEGSTFYLAEIALQANGGKLYKASGTGVYEVYRLVDYCPDEEARRPKHYYTEYYNYFIADFNQGTPLTKVDDIYALETTYPTDGIYGAYYYVKKEAIYNAPTLNLTQTENVTYTDSANMPISGTFNDYDATQTVGVRYSLEGSGGNVIKSGMAASDRVTNLADQPFQFNVQLMDVPLGTYKLYVWAQDNIGYKSVVKVLNVERKFNDPTLNLKEAENVIHYRTATMPISGTFNDLEKFQTVGVQYSLESAVGNVIKSGIVAPKVVPTAADQPFRFEILLGEDVPVGMYKLKIWAQDSADYKSVIKVLNVEKIAANKVNIINISATNNQLSFTAAGDLSPYPLHAAPYSIEVKQSGTSFSNQPWSAPNSGNNYQMNLVDLQPNTLYTITARAKNNRDLISEYTKEKYTLATVPELKVEMTKEKQIIIDITDNNPPQTEYRIVVTDSTGVEKDVDSQGRLIAPNAATNWQSLGNKKITAMDALLDPSKSYTVRAYARNTEKVLTAASTPVQTNVTEYKPVKLAAAEISIGESDATVSWQPLKDAVSYNLKLLSGTTVVNEFPTNKTSVSIDKLQPNTNYTIEIVVRYSFGESEAFKDYFTTKKKGSMAPKVLTSASELDNYAITLKWEATPEATGYQVEADGEVYSVGKELSFKHTNLPPNSRHIYRVRNMNSEGYSQWSERVILKTTRNPLPATLNEAKYSVSSTDDSIILTWEPVLNALRYEISYNGGHVINNGESNFCIRGSLNPDTQYDFTISAIDEFENSRVIASGTAKTMLLKTPKMDKVTETPQGFLVSWKPILGAESYKVMQDGVDLGITLKEPKYEVKGLGAKEVKNYSFAAVSSKGSSAWSKPISIEGISKIPQVPVNVSSAASSKSIVLTWDPAEIDEDLLYEVEVDGVTVESNDKNKYTDEQVEPFSTHIYRVRAKNQYAFSEWSEAVTITTLPGVPTSPKNIAVENSTYFATLSWLLNDSVDHYEVAVQNPDGSFNTVNIGNRNFYRQRGVLNVEQAYKIRGINMIGTGQWSSLIVNNAIKANCEKNKEIDLGLTASNIVDFEKYELQVTYNPGALEVTDLCGYTTDKELKPGKIAGTEIEIVSFEPGKIIFRVKKGIAFGNMWSGVVNNIKFKSKVYGGSYISYTVFIDEVVKNTSDSAVKEKMEE